MTDLDAYLIARALYFSRPEVILREQERHEAEIQKLKADIKKSEVAFEHYREQVMRRIGNEAEKRLYDKANEEYSLEDLYEALGVPPE